MARGAWIEKFAPRVRTISSHLDRDNIALPTRPRAGARRILLSWLDADDYGDPGMGPCSRRTHGES